MSRSFLTRMLVDIFMRKGYLPTHAYKCADTITSILPDEVLRNSELLKSEITKLSDVLIGLTNKIGEYE